MTSDFPSSFASSKIASSDVFLWLVDTRDVHQKHDIRALLSLLAEDEKLRMSSFRNAEKQHVYLLARAALRLILNAYINKPSARDITFTIGRHGKPSLSDQSAELQFNLSHSGYMVLIAVSLGRHCGVDIEALNRNRDIYKLAEFYFHPHEYAALQHCGCSPADRLLFYKLWTLKEAFIKAEGKGMAIAGTSYYFRHLESAHPELVLTVPSINSRQRWHFSHGFYGNNFSYALAVSKADDHPINICRRQFIFPKAKIL